MKRIRAMTAPTQGLSSYIDEEAAKPSYEEFRAYERGGAYRELIVALVKIQRGLCGYCEIRLVESDRQIEHVAPQHRHRKAALHVSNMIACCKGGTASAFARSDEERFLKPPKRNLSCGQAKGGRDEGFLDPRRLPALPSLFTVRDDGRIEADEQACQSAEEVEAVEKTIELLGLNVERLRAARERRWKDLLAVWSPHFESAEDMIKGARRELIPSQDGRLGAFFTTRRSFFGRYAEEVLSLAPDSWI